MAAIDTSLYGQFLRPVKSVDDYNQEADARDSRRLQLILQRSQVSDREQAMADQQRLMSALRGLPVGSTDEDYARVYLGAGMVEQADKVRKSGFERDNLRADLATKKATARKTSADADKEHIANGLSMFQAIGQITAGVKDQASYDQARQMALRHFPQLGASMAPVYDPQVIAAGRQRALSMTQQLEQEWKSKGYDLDVRRADETERDNRRQTATTIRGQNLAAQRAAEANGLRASELAGESGSGLPVLGVPAPTVTPWANQSNSKDANKVKSAEMARGAKEIEKDVDAARKEAATAQAAARFMELNKGISTGGMADKVAIGRWLQSMGSDYSELEAITAKLAPAMREPGSGSTSDFDGKQFERATVGVDKPQKANENIAKAIISRAQLSQDYADFRQTYLEQNGTLSGADRYWKQYLDKNPIFDPAKPGAFDLNAGRKAWRDHFKPGAESAKPTAAPSPSPSPIKPGSTLRFDVNGSMVP